MPKYSSVASITTLWENNPDTPITAANLSRLQDLTVSYLNTDDESFGIHVEGSILYPHPTDSKFIILKRGTIIQIVNESVDMIGNPIIPKNSMYRIFDVGLEDIIITYADIDETQLNKTTWGNGNNEWFVFLCDKDDTIIYNKNTPDEYGGGAQILISKYSDYPRGQIPGRPLYNYSKKDVRLIGGFKTNDNNIIPSSVWDIAGKYDKIKAKAYYVLDEYKDGGAEYRKIQLSDLNTAIPSQFNSSVIISGNLNTNNIVAKNTTFLGLMSQTGNINIIGNEEISGNIIVNGTANISNKLTTGQVDIFGNMLIDSILTIKRGNNIAIFDSTINFTAPITHTGNYNLTGNLTQNGIFSQTGNVILGGSGRTISFTGTTTVNGNTVLNGNLTIPSVDNLTTLFSINRDTRQIIMNAHGFVLNSEVQINDKFSINSGAQDITIYTTRNILSSVGSSYEWKNSGNMKVDSGIFTVQQNSSNKVFEVLPTNQINANAAFSAVIPSGKTFTVKNHLGNTILGVEHDINLPSEKRVAINTVLDLSASSADNALNVTGNGRFTGNLTVSGTLFANIQGSVVGGASSWTNNLTINLTGGVGGSVTFKGNEGSVNLITQVYNDSHTHDTRYYTETELQTSGSALVHWGNISNKPATYQPAPHTHAEYLENSSITWQFLLNRGLVGSAGGEFGSEEVLARINHNHNSLYSNINHNHNTLYSNINHNHNLLYSDINHNHNSTYALIGNYAVIDTDVNFSTINANTIFSNNISSRDGLSVYSSDGINFRQNKSTIGDEYKLYSLTNGSALLFNDKRIVLSNDTSNTAPFATQLITPQVLSFIPGNGVSFATVNGQIGDGGSIVQADLTLDAEWIATQLDGTGLTRSGNTLNVEFGMSGTQAAPGNHTHTNSTTIGGPYSSSTHGHINDVTIGGPYSSSTHGHINDVTIGGPYSLSTHGHSDIYTKAEVQSLTDQLLQNILNSYPGTVGTKSIINPISGNNIIKTE